MNGFFYPESAVIIGASSRQSNMGRAIAVNMIDYRFSGRLFLVGRSGGYLYGHKIRESLDLIADPIETAVIITPAATVPGFMEQCGRKGIKRVIIESSGFGEFDESRRGLEGELLAIAERYGMRFIGPNCIGVMNLENGFVTPFPRVSSTLRPGHIGIIAQSGGVGLTYVNFLDSERIGISKFVSVGNKLNVDENDLLEYLIADETTEVIGMYLESISDGRRLVELAQRTEKPILIHKSNTAPTSHRIAASHTAALSADEAVVDAAFRRAGIIRIRETRAMVNYLKILTEPKMKGRRVAIVSRSGGHAVLAADACAYNHLELPQFPRQFLDDFEKHFRGGVIKIQNPIDLGDLFDFSVYHHIAEAILKRDGVDGVLFVHGYRGDEAPASRRFVENVAEMVKLYEKPVALCLLCPEAEVAYVKENYDFPIFTSPEEAATCLKISFIFQHLDRGKPAEAAGRPELDEQLISQILEESPLGLSGSLRLAEAAGLSTAAWREVGSNEEALQAAEELGWPVVLKAGLAEVSHKSDVGGVILGLDGPDKLKQGLERLSGNLAQAGHAEPWPVVVQAMAASGEEVIIGGRQDPTFGPVVLVGLGGIMVEVMGDVALSLAPVTSGEAAEMIADLKGGRVLDGLRGQPEADKAALAEAMVRVSHLLSRFPQIKEIDLNPTLALAKGQGALVLDARVVIGQ